MNCILNSTSVLWQVDHTKMSTQNTMDSNSWKEAESTEALRLTKISMTGKLGMFRFQRLFIIHPVLLLGPKEQFIAKL